MILSSSALQLAFINNMNKLIIDAAAKDIFLSFINDENIYTCTHENSKSNFEKLIILINDFLKDYSITINDINIIYVNRGPGSFAGIRNSISLVKGLFLTNKIDYYCFSFLDFHKTKINDYQQVPQLCSKFKIKKNLINPIYLS